MAVLIVDSRGQPWAAPYYAVFDSEPVGAGASIRITKTLHVKTWHFPALLEAIESVGSGKDILIAGHGRPAGLSVPLAPGFDKTAAQVVQLRSLMGSAKVESKANVCGIPVAAVQKILALRAKILKLRIPRVELRACEIGQSAVTLAAYKDFFGAGTVGAPDMLDFFGNIDCDTPTSDAATWARWQKQHPGARVYGTAAGRVAIYRLLRFSCLADSARAIQAWIGSHLPATKKAVGAPKFPVHAFVGKEFLFPAESGYVKHIKHYSKGNPLLQDDIFGGTGRLDDAETRRERRICARSGFRPVGPIGGVGDSHGPGPLGLA